MTLSHQSVQPFGELLYAEGSLVSGETQSRTFRDEECVQHVFDYLCSRIKHWRQHVKNMHVKHVMLSRKADANSIRFLKGKKCNPRFNFYNFVCWTLLFLC